MTEPNNAPDEGTEPEPATRDELEALTKDQLHEQYGVAKTLTKTEMVDVILGSLPQVPTGDVPLPRTSPYLTDPTPPVAGDGEVLLAAGFPTDSFRVGDFEITSAGTPVAAGDVDDIIAAGNSAGVTIRKVS